MSEQGENITTKFKVDVSDLKKGISEATSQIKLANAQFAAATAGMDKWEESSEGVTAKLNQLGTTLEAENAKLDNYREQMARLNEAAEENGRRADELRAAHEQAVEAFGENSEEAKRLAKALAEVEKEQEANKKAAQAMNVTVLQQEAAVGKTEKEIRNYTDRLSEIEDASDDAADSADDLEDALDDVGDSADKAGDKADGLGDKLADLAKNGFAALASAATAAVTAFFASAEATREYRTEMAKLETSFTQAGFSAETATETYKDFYGILGDEGQAVEAVSFLSKLTDNQEELSKWTDIAAGVYGKFGASLPLESLTEAANETAKTGSLTGALSDAINWAGLSEEKFQEQLDLCNNETERAALITKVLNDVYGEAGEAYQETAKDIIDANKAQAELTDAMAEVGAVAEPVMTSLKLLGAEMLTSL